MHVSRATERPCRSLRLCSVVSATCVAGGSISSRLRLRHGSARFALSPRVSSPRSRFSRVSAVLSLVGLRVCGRSRSRRRWCRRCAHRGMNREAAALGRSERYKGASTTAPRIFSTLVVNTKKGDSGIFRFKPEERLTGEVCTWHPSPRGSREVK